MQLYTKILIGMLVGIVLGFLLGPNSSLLPQDGIDLRSGVKVYVTPGGAESPWRQRPPALKSSRLLHLQINHSGLRLNSNLPLQTY